MKIGGPTSENTSARLALQRYTSDGFTNNQWLNRNDTNARDELTARGAARWQLNEHLFETGLYYTRVNNGYDAFSLDNTRNTLSDEPGEDDLTLKAARIKWQGPIGPYQGWLQLSHADTETTYSYDEDWSFVGIAPGWEYQSFDEYRRDRTMTSLEWRVQPLSGGRTAWILGTFLRHQRETLTRDYSYLPGPFSSKIETDTGAIFAEVNCAFTDTLSGFIGARLERRESHYRDSAAVNTPFDHDYWTGRTGLTWTYQRGQQTYLTLSRGARAGGANASLLASIEALPDLDQNRVSGFSIFDEETLISLEWGWQGFWPEINLQSRLAIFAMERDDQQVRGSVVIPRNDGSTAFIDYTDNAAAGHHRGLEWEARWQPNEGWHWQLNLGILDAQFDEYVSATGENLSGREQPQSPSWQYSLGARWDIHPLAAVQLEVAGSDRYFFSDRHEVANDEIHQLNASISGGRGRWQWTLWGRNLTDRDTYTRGFGTFGNDPRKQYTVEPYRQYGEPRVVGVTIRYELFEGHQ
jgi:outer membrane receptor protein involved in Fe transport